MWNIVTSKFQRVSYLTVMVIKWSIHQSHVVFTGEITGRMSRNKPTLSAIFMALECNGGYWQSVKYSYNQIPESIKFNCYGSYIKHLSLSCCVCEWDYRGNVK